MSTAAGQVVLDTDFDAIELASSQKPICRVVGTAPAQNVANNTITAITFLQEDIDTHGFHSTSVNTSRITPTVPGCYRLTGCWFTFGRTDWSFATAWFRINGVSNPATAARIVNSVTSTGIVSFYCEAIVNLNGTTDYVELVAQHANTGAAAVATSISSQNSCIMEAEYLRGIA